MSPTVESWSDSARVGRNNDRASLSLPPDHILVTGFTRIKQDCVDARSLHC